MPEIAELEARLDRLLKSRPDLEEAAGLQRDLLRECYRGRPRLEPLRLSPEQARGKLGGGVPILHGEDVTVDISFCRDLFGRLLNTLQRRPQSAEAAGEIAHAAAAERLDVERCVGEALANHSDHLFEIATWSMVSPEVLATVLEMVTRPPLQALSATFQSLLNESDDWKRGYCPMCGAWPGLTELRMAEQHRYLRCLRCGAAWPSRRLLCVFCGNDDHRSLGYLQGQREPRFRVEVCERCKAYLKAMNAFESSAPEYLLLDDLASVHLDIAALERGYARPQEPGFRLEFASQDPSLFSNRMEYPQRGG
jgi:FdhE protein